MELYSRKSPLDLIFKFRDQKINPILFKRLDFYPLHSRNICWRENFLILWNFLHLIKGFFAAFCLQSFNPCRCISLLQLELFDFSNEFFRWCTLFLSSNRAWFKKRMNQHFLYSTRFSVYTMFIFCFQSLWCFRWNTKMARICEPRSPNASQWHWCAIPSLVPPWLSWRGSWRKARWRVS